MAYKPLSKKPTEQPSKNISKPIVGSLVSEGRSEVTIQSIEKINASLKMKLVNNFNETHTSNLFLLDLAGQDLSYKLKQLISAASNSPRELTKIYEDLDNNKVSSILGFVNRKIGVELCYSEGYTITRTPEGYQAAWSQGSKTFDKILELHNAMLELGYQESYLIIKDFYRLERDEDVSETKTPDFMDEFIGTSTPEAKENKATTRNESPQNLDKSTGGPDTTGWL